MPKAKPKPAAAAEAGTTRPPPQPERAPGLLKISQLAERSGVKAGTIKHYLREGLLGPGDDVVRTSRNMAYYPEDYVERLTLIKRLQEDRFMPLRIIRQLLDEDPQRIGQMIELEDRILERSLQDAEIGRVSRTRVLEAYDLPAEVLDRLAEIGILTPTRRGYDKNDIEIIVAMSRFRAGGYEQRIGFTVYDTLRYRKALEPLVEEEAEMLLERLAGRVDPDEAFELIRKGAEPLRDMIGALHSKLLVEALQRKNGAS